MREDIFFTGGINTDDDIRTVPKGDYRYAMYSRTGEVSGHGNCIVTSLGTVKINNSSLTQFDKVLGGFAWEKENSIVYVVYKADLLHQIWQLNLSDETNTLICESTDFNFVADIPVLHGNIIGDLFKFVQPRWDSDEMYSQPDGDRIFNPPYQINLRKALDGEYPVIDLQVIDAVKWPLAPPTCVYDTDQTRADNKLRRKLFKFMVQPIYENDEVGNWSLYSNLALPTQSEYVSGTNWPDSSQDNVIKVTFNTGPNVVKKINVAVQQFDENSGGVENPFGLFLQIDKAQQAISDDVDYTIDFYGNVSTKPIVYSKNYDRLPIWANCQEYLVTNELAYVNIREGFNKLTDLDCSASYELTEINWANEIVSIFLDGLGGSSYEALLSWLPVGAFSFIAGDTFTIGVQVQNYDTSDITTVNLSYTITQADIEAAETNIDDTPSNYMLWIIATAYAEQINTTLGIANAFVAQALPYPSNVAVLDGHTTATNFSIDTVVTYAVNRQTNVVRSCKQGATMEFGIVYGDRAYRDGTVQTIPELSTFVKLAGQEDLSGFTDPNNPYSVSPVITINHLPPIWPDRYWLVAREITEILSSGQWIINSTDPSTAIFPDENRYRIDLDKYYVETNIGATINHQIQKGDVARFIRKRLDNAVPTPTSGYVESYFELEVLDYDATGGNDGRQAIWVEQFDLTLIDPDTWTGQLIEIYTPRPALDTEGNLFVAEWRDCTPAIPIGNAHTRDRYHDFLGQVSGTGKIEGGQVGTDQCYLYGDQTSLLGYFIEVTNSDGDTFYSEITSVSYDPMYSPPATLVTVSGVVFTAGSTTWVATNGERQQVLNGVSTDPAIIKPDYGNAYVRQRNYATGYDAVNTSAYWFIEDPNYSDYWTSSIYEEGRFRVEDPNAKQVHRQAAIHSESFILNTEINGLSTFSLSNDNIQDLNPIHGDVTRVFNAGREGKTLKCLQPRKENSIYINFYPDVADTPQGNLRVDRNRTFASWFDFNTLYGCRDGGGAALLPDGSVMYFDPLTQAFIYSAGNGQMVVSELDPLTKNNFKFRTKTKELVQRTKTTPFYVRSFVNESVGEVGFGFAFEATPSVSFELDDATSGSNEATFLGDLSNYKNVQVSLVLVDEGTGETTTIYPTITSVTYVKIIDASLVKFSVNMPLTTKTGTLTILATYEYDTVVFDYVRMRWRSGYDYPFQCFANFGEALVGFGEDSQPYLHNQTGYVFHGQNALQSISPVSNENPLRMKRYQTLIQISDKTWSFSCEADANISYSQMGTEMANYLFEIYEGYSQCDFRKNKYDPSYSTQEMAMMEGEDVRATALDMTIEYNPVDKNVGSIIFGLGINYELS